MYDMPPVLTGTLQEQITQLWEYIYRVTEKHNVLDGTNRQTSDHEQDAILDKIESQLKKN